MGKFYIINAPYLFSTVWTLVKPWLDEVTVKKISILDSSYPKTLMEQIPADSLPKTLKGVCQCEGGCSLSDSGPWKDVEAVAKAKKLKAGDLNDTPAKTEEPANTEAIPSIETSVLADSAPAAAPAATEAATA